MISRLLQTWSVTTIPNTNVKLSTFAAHSAKPSQSNTRMKRSDNVIMNKLLCNADRQTYSEATRKLNFLYFLRHSTPCQPPFSFSTQRQKGKKKISYWRKTRFICNFIFRGRYFFVAFSLILFRIYTSKLRFRTKDFPKNGILDSKWESIGLPAFNFYSFLLVKDDYAILTFFIHLSNTEK